MKNCVRPKMAQLVEALNEYLMPIFDPEGTMFLDFEDPVPRDRIALVEEYAKAVDKWLTKNEIRNLEGYGDLEGGDEIWQPLALTTMSNPTPNTPEVQTVPKPTEEQPENPEKPEENPEEAPKTYRVLRSKGKKPRRDFSEQIARLQNRNIRLKQMKEELTQAIKKALRSKIKPVVKEKYEPKYRDMRTKEDTDLYIKTILQNSDRFEAKINDVMKWKFYQPQMETIMRKLERGTKFILTRSMPKIQKQVGDEFMFNEDREVAVGIDLLTPLLKDILITQGAEAMLTVSPNVIYSLLDEARKYLNRTPTKIAKTITETAYTRVRSSLSEGIKTGESVAKLKDRVIEQYKSLERYQAEAIARTEVARATNFATIDAFKQSGVVEGKEWIVTPDDRLCEFCMSMEMEYNAKIGLDDNYFKLGDTINGTEGGQMKIEFDNVAGPPLHVNCRCVLKAVEKMVAKEMPKKKRRIKRKEDELLAEVERELNDTRGKSQKSQKKAPRAKK